MNDHASNFHKTEKNELVQFVKVFLKSMSGGKLTIQTLAKSAVPLHSCGLYNPLTLFCSLSPLVRVLRYEDKKRWLVGTRADGINI